MATTLGIEPNGTRFLINGEPTFLLGASYYGGLGAPEEFVEQDLADLKRLGFNWIRLWCTWGPFGRDVSAVTPSGGPREPGMSRLRAICERADRMGMIVDVTFGRGQGIINSSPLGGVHTDMPIVDQAGHVNAVRTIAEALMGFRNAYFDLANERNAGPSQHVTFEELAELARAVRRIDPERLLTASDSRDIPLDQIAGHLKIAGENFLTPHRPRHAGTAAETPAKTREYLDEAARVLGHPVPVHYQEPFRIAWGKWVPGLDDFLADLRGAVEAGAAGWCFHNGHTTVTSPDGRPRKAFDLGSEEGRLFDQLNDVELAVVQRAAEVCREA
ncbi:MAG: hypothetical protein GX591_02140 [Planctomycetes bacterium]|nr:hypothetical protein [Planctomycetota bacterium]